MTTFVRVEIDGTVYNDVITGLVTSKVGDTNSASDFSLTYSNVQGQFTNVFTIGKEVGVWLSDMAIPITGGTKIFIGILEDRKFSGKSGKERITILGRDYTARLQDLTIPPTVFTNEEISDIIAVIMADVPDVTYNKVATGLTLQRIAFNHNNIFDALKRLAGDVFTFFIDTNKVLQFKTKGTTSSGKVFNNTNIINATWLQTRKEIVNQVWVYGDKELNGFSENFTADGVGSVFKLQFSPYSINVKASGLQKKGGVLEMISVPVSGEQYLVSFHDKQFVFTSGTEVGNNIPVSGVLIETSYDKASPIIKFGRDRSSIAAYGLKEKIIQNKTIKDPNEAVQVVKDEIAAGANLKVQGTLYIDGEISLTAGQTCLVDLPNDGIDNQTYEMLEIKYTIDKKKLLADQGIKIIVNKKIKDFTDTMKDALLSIRDIQGADIDTSDGLTRLEFAEGSIGIKQNWYLKTRNIGSSIVFDSDTRFAFDTPSGLSPGSWFFDALSGIPFTITKSGGIF